MTQDFAKIRPEPLLERKPVASPPAWSLMVTGVVVGISIGVFACVLFYLSGNVPPLNSNSAPAVSQISALEAQPETNPESEEELQLEFYSALSEYEVAVDAVPVALENDPESESNSETTALAPASTELADENLGTGFILQTGAFQQQELAQSEMRRQQTLGLDVVVRQQELLGRTLYLVQSGPYTSSRQLGEAENLLRRSNIPSLRMRLQ